VNGKRLQVEQIRNQASGEATTAVVLAEASCGLRLHVLSSLHRNLTFTLRMLGTASVSAALD
jgi:hypothetical protein